MIKWRDRT